MVKVYYYDNVDADPRLPHEDPSTPSLTLDAVKPLGVRYWAHDVSSESAYNAAADAICAERSYKNRDVITISRSTLPNYDAKIASFFDEHLHEDEEIRFILEGSGYFDVRSPDDVWIRIALVAGEMIVLPAGIFHRFTLDSSDYIKAMRLFKDDPKWTPLSRSKPETAAVPSRAEFLASLEAKPDAEKDVAVAAEENEDDGEDAKDDETVLKAATKRANDDTDIDNEDDDAPATKRARISSSTNSATATAVVEE